MPEEYPVAMNVTLNGRIISEAKSWEKIFGGTEDDGGESVQQTVDGRYTIYRKTTFFGAGYSDSWLIKTDDQGNV